MVFIIKYPFQIFLSCILVHQSMFQSIAQLTILFLKNSLKKNIVEKYYLSCLIKLQFNIVVQMSWT
jgi:hypothetical protein